MPAVSARRVRRNLAVVAVALLTGGCSVADNLNCDEILTELDGIVRIEGSGNEQHIGYADRAPVSEFYMRWILTYPLRGLLGWTFGKWHEVDLEAPATHVRTLLRELPDETGDDLLSNAEAASRFDWIAELDSSPDSRIVAIDGLAAVAQQLALPMFEGPLDQLGTPADPATVATARVGVQVGRPDVRGSGDWDATRLAPYTMALINLTERPLDSAIERVHLVEDLTALYAAEKDDTVRPFAGKALRAALVHMVHATLLGILQSRDPRFVELRAIAMEHVRRLGGPRTVPLLLAVMSASPAELSRGEPRFDPDSLIELRLVHYCGQLTGELFETAVKLPGRKDWVAMSPADFLVTKILNETAYYSKLRTPALAALSWSLRRPRLDPDPTWVREWKDSRRP